MNIDYCHPDEAFLRTIDVHGLLPQQEPFVFISALTALGRSHVVTETAVGSRCRLVSNGMMTTAGMIEMMAQTCAARVGYINKFILKRGVVPGLLAAVRGMSVSGHPRIGQTAVTSVVIEASAFGMTSARAEISAGGETMAVAEIRLADAPAAI